MKKRVKIKGNYERRRCCLSGPTPDLADVERVRVSEKELSQFQIKEGDFFFTRSSLKREGVGWCAIVDKLPELAVFEYHVMRIAVNPVIALPKYVLLYWHHPDVRAEVIENANTSTMTTMNQSDLSHAEIPVPPIKVQKEVVNKLVASRQYSEKVTTNIEAELDTINALPGTLLRKAFSGEV